jgi:NhaP-type Na+/H+ and K+/H+ antiporter
VVVGDRVSIGSFELTVRELDEDGVITSVGLKCPGRLILG